LLNNYYFRSLIAAVELINNNAKDLGDLQHKVQNWHAQGLDDREITLRAKDEQLKSKLDISNDIIMLSNASNNFTLFLDTQDLFLFQCQSLRII
jgi:hypothetical protein